LADCSNIRLKVIKMNINKLIRIFILFLSAFITAGCFSFAVKDYNPLEQTDILPGKDQVEVKYATSLGSFWSTEVILGPDLEYVNVGFNYQPNKKNQFGYANQLFKDIDDIRNRKIYQYMLDDEMQMTNLWVDLHSFNLNNISISFPWVYKD
jgi:hypothetical protein